MMTLVPQRRSFDCGVACVSTLTGVAYEDVFFLAAKIAGERIRMGLTLTELVKVLRRLGRRFVPVDHRKVDLDEDSGILSIRWIDRPRWADGHVVILSHGTIIEVTPTIQIWNDAKDYMTENKAKHGTLLMEKD